MKQILLLLLILLFTGCVKNSTFTVSPQITNAKLSKVTVSSKTIYYTSIYHFTYNAIGKVDSMFIFSSNPQNHIIKVFDYHPGYYTINTYDPSSKYYPSPSSITVQLNDKGLITDVPGTNFTYNDKGQLLSRIDTTYAMCNNVPCQGFDHVIEYEWSDLWDNCVYAYDDHKDPVRYIFDVNRQGQTGDVENIEDFLFYGRTLLNSRNIPISVHSIQMGSVSWATSSDNSDYIYTYDQIGRILSLQTTDNSYLYKYY